MGWFRKKRKDPEVEAVEEEIRKFLAKIQVIREKCGEKVKEEAEGHRLDSKEIEVAKGVCMAPRLRQLVPEYLELHKKVEKYISSLDEKLKEKMHIASMLLMTVEKKD